MKSLIILIFTAINLSLTSVIPDNNECYKSHMATFEPYLNKSLDPEINRRRFYFISTTSKQICMTSEELLEKFGNKFFNKNLMPNNLDCYKAELKKLQSLFDPESNLTIGAESAVDKNCTEAKNYITKIAKDFTKSTSQLYEEIQLVSKTCTDDEFAVHSASLQKIYLRNLIINNSNFTDDEKKDEKLISIKILSDLGEERLLCVYGDLKDEN